jgi:hypothetical protein
LEHNLITEELRNLQKNLLPICEEIISEPIYLSKFPGIPDNPKIEMKLVVNLTGFHIRIHPVNGDAEFSTAVNMQCTQITQSILNGDLVYDTEFHDTQRIFNKFIKNYNDYISAINRQDGFELAKSQPPTPTATTPTEGETIIPLSKPQDREMASSIENISNDSSTINITFNISSSDDIVLTNKIEEILSNIFRKSSST